MVYYPIPLHLQPVNRGLGYASGSLPETERAAREVLSLPISPELTEETQRAVVEALKALLTAARTQVPVTAAVSGPGAR
jgi:dTDP-4-amino-4,6-dideoxygalactose transaminase